MKAIPEGYKPEDSFEQYPDGTYQVKSMEWFSVNDEDESPILVAQKDGKLVGRLRFTLVYGKDGPPMSLTLGEMGLLVKAFGADITQLPEVPKESQAGEVSLFMSAVKSLINNADSTVELTVKNGWPSNVKGMELPKSTQNFILTSVGRKDDTGVPILKQGTYGRMFWPEFTLVAGPGGTKSPFKGAVISPLVNYAVTNENGEVDWEHTKSGSGYTSNAVRLSNLMRMTAPVMFQGEFTPKHKENLLLDWEENLPAKPIVLSFSVTYNDKGYPEIAWATIEPAGYEWTEEVKQPEPTKEQKEEMAKPEIKESPDNVDKKSYDILVDTIRHLAGKEEVTKENGSLNDAGLAVAKEYFTPLRKDNKLTHSTFPNYGYEEAKVVLEAVKELKPDDETIEGFYDNLMIVGIRLDESIEDEETPF